MSFGQLPDVASAGSIAAVSLEEEGSNLDGYTIYLPQSYEEHEGTYPILVYLQGAYGVGGQVSDVIHWGLPRLLRDETELTTERNQLLLDNFIVLCLHIQDGNYHDDPEKVQGIIDATVRDHKGDPTRVYVTGLSRGGHGAWGLATRLPNTFAAVAPIGGGAWAIDSYPALAGQAIWIGHNLQDGNIEYSQADAAAVRIEEGSDHSFLRVQPNQLAGSDYLEREYIFTSDPYGAHDAWTDVYSNSEFYKWLLTKTRAIESGADDVAESGDEAQ